MKSCPQCGSKSISTYRFATSSPKKSCKCACCGESFHLPKVYLYIAESFPYYLIPFVVVFSISDSNIWPMLSIVSIIFVLYVSSILFVTPRKKDNRGNKNGALRAGAFRSILLALAAGGSLLYYLSLN